jgi:hypothetical protein
VVREPDIDAEIGAMHCAPVEYVRQDQSEGGKHNPDRDCAAEQAQADDPRTVATLPADCLPS